jgi:hypothetical protein
MDVRREVSRFAIVSVEGPPLKGDKAPGDAVD